MVQQLLATVIGPILDREQIAALLRVVTLTTTLSNETTKPANKPRSRNTARPNAYVRHRAFTHNQRISVALPKFTGYENIRSQQEFGWFGEYCDICSIAAVQMLSVPWETSAIQCFHGHGTDGFMDWNTSVSECNREFATLHQFLQTVGRARTLCGSNWQKASGNIFMSSQNIMTT